MSLKDQRRSCLYVIMWESQVIQNVFTRVATCSRASGAVVSVITLIGLRFGRGFQLRQLWRVYGNEIGKGLRKGELHASVRGGIYNDVVFLSKKVKGWDQLLLEPGENDSEDEAF